MTLSQATENSLFASFGPCSASYWIPTQTSPLFIILRLIARPSRQIKSQSNILNYQQDDWISLLPLIEFAYNSSPHLAMQVSLLFTIKGYHSKFEIGIDNVTQYAAQQIVENLSSLYKYLYKQVCIIIQQYAKAAEGCQMVPLSLRSDLRSASTQKNQDEVTLQKAQLPMS